MQTMAELTAQFPRQGRVEWIGISTERRGPIQVLDAVEAELKTGLKGDRHARGGRSKRQVTLIQAEHLIAVGAMIGRAVGPQEVRRNIVVQGINLYAMRKALFRVGDVLLQGTGLCDPCSRMEENLGEGGFNAMRGHGGITAIVVEPGTIAIGDKVQFVENTEGFTAKQDLH